MTADEWTEHVTLPAIAALSAAIVVLAVHLLATYV